MSATFWNMRRRLAAKKVAEAKQAVEKPVETVEKAEPKPKKKAVKENV